MSMPLERLRAEGAVLGRYLLGQEPRSEAVARYVEGCARVLAEPFAREDVSLVAFACRHPWSLPCLDAACGLLRPQSLLRQKTILMLAILETMPEHASLFLPVPRPRAVVVLRLIAAGAASALKTAAGLAILPVARWGR